MSTAANGLAFGTSSQSLSTTGTVTLAGSALSSPALNLTGTMTGNVTLAFPNAAGFWLVSTASLALGGHVLTFASGSGTVSPIAVGQVYVVTCFGANTIATSIAVGSSVTVAAGTGISVSGGPAYTVTNTVALPTLTNHDLVVGQGTTAPAFLAPGSSGNAPVSNGTDFVSQAIPTSIVAGTGISVSGSTGAVTVTNSSPSPALPVTVPNGGTGDTTLTAHGVLIGQGASAVTTITGTLGNNGQALLSTGAGSDPTYGPVALSGSTIGVTSTLGHANGGTDVASAGTAGNVLTSTGSAWSSAAPAFVTSVFVSRAGATVTSAVTVLNSATITVPAGKKLNIQMWFDFGPNSDGTGLEDDMDYGDGINSSTTFSTKSTVTIPGQFGVVATGRTSGAFLDQTSTTGSVIVYALAQVTAGGAVNNPASAAILLTTTN